MKDIFLDEDFNPQVKIKGNREKIKNRNDDFSHNIRFCAIKLLIGKMMILLRITKSWMFSSKDNFTPTIPCNQHKILLLFILRVGALLFQLIFGKSLKESEIPQLLLQVLRKFLVLFHIILVIFALFSDKGKAQRKQK